MVLRRWLPSAALLLFAGSLAGESSAIEKSTAGDRSSVSITVYNQNFGLVREVRKIALGTGRVSLEMADVAATIQPETVAIKSLGKADDLAVLEQNYRFDLLTPSTLLEKHVGKKIRAYRYNESSGKETGFDATLLSVADGRPVLEIGGEITYDWPGPGATGRFGFPGLPPNLISKPTLVWLLESQAPKQEIEITYLAQSMTWNADYVMVIDEADRLGDLTGWVTLTNQSGAEYQDAQLKLVAGDVNRVSPSSGVITLAEVAADEKKEEGESFREESLFEYHLYTLGRPTDVLDNEQKQVRLLEANGVKLKKRLLFFGEQYWYRGQYGELQSNQKVGVYIDLSNSKDNGLGMPLPKGIVRVYKADKSGARQFVGEDRIDHTPKDEKVRIKMGDAFDVVGSRKQTDWDELGRCTSESEWEIELRNHKDTAQDVEVWEPIGGDWTMLSSSHEHTKQDAFTFTFDVSVPANGKTKITYRVRVKWC
jgi:hypothetical protein